MQLVAVCMALPILFSESYPEPWLLICHMGQKPEVWKTYATATATVYCALRERESLEAWLLSLQEGRC